MSGKGDGEGVLRARRRGYVPLFALSQHREVQIGDMKTQRTASGLVSRARKVEAFMMAILIVATGEITTFGQAATPASTAKAASTLTPGVAAPEMSGASAPAAPATPGTSPAATPGASAAATSAAGPAPAAAPSAAAVTNTPAEPPGAPAERSEADLDKLVAPIALYPDPLLATVLPACAYPLEIVQAARFVKDTNNVAKLDAQPWDNNVKAVARFPDVISLMNENIQWTSDLGDAFINQPKGVTDAIQRMRTKAQDSGALKTSEQQVVTVTNTVVTNVVQQQAIVVTNQVVQIQPSSPEVIYVPQYNPTVVYGGYPVAYPGYVYPPSYPVAGAAISFGLGMAAGAIVANNCDWGHGGCWGGYHGDVDVDVNRDVNRETTRNVNRTDTANRNVNRTDTANRGQKWQPDQNRLKNSGSTLSSTQSREARGYGTGGTGSARTGATAARTASTTPRTTSPSARSPSSTPSTPPSTTTPRAGGAGSGAGVSSGSRQSSSSASSRPSEPSVSRPAASSGSSRSTASASASRPSSSGASAFSGGGGAQTRSASARGSASRGGGGGGGRGGRR